MNSHFNPASVYICTYTVMGNQRRLNHRGGHAFRCGWGSRDIVSPCSPLARVGVGARLAIAQGTELAYIVEWTGVLYVQWAGYTTGTRISMVAPFLHCHCTWHQIDFRPC